MRPLMTRMLDGSWLPARQVARCTNPHQAHSAQPAVAIAAPRERSVVAVACEDTCVTAAGSRIAACAASGGIWLMNAAGHVPAVVPWITSQAQAILCARTTNAGSADCTATSTQSAPTSGAICAARLGTRHWTVPASCATSASRKATKLFTVPKLDEDQQQQ